MLNSRSKFANISENKVIANNSELTCTVIGQCPVVLEVRYGMDGMFHIHCLSACLS